MSRTVRTRRSRTVAMAIAAGVLCLSCADTQAAVLNDAPTVAGSLVIDAPTAEGAVLRGGAQAESADGVAALVAVSPTDATAQQALRSGQDLVEGLVARLGANQVLAAATLTTGEAKEMFQRISQSQACGVRFGESSTNAVVSDAELVGVDRFRLMTNATLQIDGGVERTLQAVIVERQDTSGWLISDLLVDGMDTATMVPRPDNSGILEREVRFTETRGCVGPNRIEVDYTITNQADYPYVPAEVYFLDATGTRHDLAVGVDLDQVFEVIPGRETGTISLAVNLDNGFDGGRFVVVATDLEETQREGATVTITREFAVSATPLFTNHNALDQSIAAITEEPAS